MTLPYVPRRGAILICDFDMACVPPEMRKQRRVVVVSPRAYNRNGLAVVVPFSATQPNPVRPVHVPIPAGAYVSLTLPVWAICVCVAHVSFNRLASVKVGRRFLSEQLSDGDMGRVEEGLRHALGL